MSDDLLQRAAGLLAGAENYNRSPADSVFDPNASSFCASGLLERANTRHVAGRLILFPGPKAPLAEAKARVCRLTGFPHIDLWESATKPDWKAVRYVLEMA